jgi:hypothetical protein
MDVFAVLLSIIYLGIVLVFAFFFFVLLYKLWHMCNDVSGIKKQLVSKDDVISLVKQRDFDVLVVLGAGDLDALVPQITKILKTKKK